LVFLTFYDGAAPCPRRLVGGDFIVAVVFVLTDPAGCVHLDHGASRVHHDCVITIVIQKLLRENLMALT
jgi:hypothetical protein